MPLHADEEARSGRFDRLHDTASVARHDAQVLPGRCHGVAMQAVDVQHRGAERVRESAAGRDRHRASRCDRVEPRALDVELVEIVRERSAALEVHELRAATDPEHGQTTTIGRREQLALESIARVVDRGTPQPAAPEQTHEQHERRDDQIDQAPHVGEHAMPSGGAVLFVLFDVHRIAHVGSPAEHEPVQRLERPFARRRESTRPSAGEPDRHRGEHPCDPTTAVGSGHADDGFHVVPVAGARSRRTRSTHDGGSDSR